MKYNKMYIETRIASLKSKPVENANIIKKWMRRLRKCDE